jgi:hypothetical protein
VTEPDLPPGEVEDGVKEGAEVVWGEVEAVGDWVLAAPVYAPNAGRRFPTVEVSPVPKRRAPNAGSP